MNQYQEALSNCKTMGDVMGLLFSYNTVEDVQGFMEAYRADCQYADANIACGLGHSDAEKERVYRKLIAGEQPDELDGLSREELAERLKCQQ